MAGAFRQRPPAGPGRAPAVVWRRVRRVSRLGGGCENRFLSVPRTAGNLPSAGSVGPVARVPGVIRRRIIRASLAATAALLSMLAGTGSALSVESLGAAVAVIPNAVGELGGEQVTIIRGTQLFEGQTITTEPNGEVQLVFVDDTRMVIGPNSALQIERYLLRDPTSFGQLAVNALGGTFRFISDNSPSEAYSVNTPGGTIGVRAPPLTRLWSGRTVRLMSWSCVVRFFFAPTAPNSARC